jgi:hypothetical protein
VSAIGDHLKGAGRFYYGLAQLAAAPAAAVYGGASAPVGYGMASAERAIGEPIAKSLNPNASFPEWGEQYQTAKEETARALQAAQSRAGLPRWAGRGASAPAAPPALPSEALANQAAADEFGVKLSRGQATGSLDDTRYEDLAAREAYGKPAQDVAAPFFNQQFEDIQGAGRNIGEQVARNQAVAATPSEAASTVNAEVGGAASQAQRARDAAAAQAVADADATRGIVRDQGQALTEAIQGGHLPIENPREAGEIVGHEVRTQAATDRQGYQDRYNQAFSLPGEFHAATFEGIGNRIQGALTLRDNSVIIDDVTTPIASRAIRDLDNISNLRIQNRADPFGAPNPENITAVDLRGVDQARKRLTAFYRAARSSNNPADARAAGSLIDEFDNQVEGAMSNGLFSGDPQALSALQQARAAYSSYARNYRPQQAGDDVGTAMRRIIDRQATPEEIANMITGSGRLGNAGLPVRLAGRLEQVLGRNSDAWSTIRQALWQRASQVRNSVGEIDAGRSAQSIADFSGSSLGRRMFSQQELAAMRAHAQGVRGLDQLIEQSPAAQAAQQAQTGYQQAFGGEGIGGAQQAAFRRIVEGTATPEETVQSVFNSIGGGNPGNTTRLLSSVERIAGPQSDTMAAIRQGVWQKLTQNAAGKDAPGQQKLAQSINEFLNGKGRTIAERLYSDSERALMQRYADVVKRTVIPKYARTNSDTTPALMSMLSKYGSSIAAALGAGVEGITGGFSGGVLGGLAGSRVGQMIEKATGAVRDVGAAKKVSKQFDWLNQAQAPKAPPRPSPRQYISSAVAGSNLGAQVTRALPPPPPPISMVQRGSQ